MKKLTFTDLIAILAYLFALLDLVTFMYTGYSPKIFLKFSITFLCLSLMLNQLKEK